MTGTETVLAGLVISFTSISVGGFLANRKKVSQDSCKERRIAIAELNNEKLKSIDTHLGSLDIKVDSIVEGLKKGNFLTII